MKRAKIILLVILLVAAFLRLYKIADYMTFLGDEGRDVLVVKRMIVDFKPTLLGPTASVGGFFLGPIYYYFMIPFLWLWGLSPVGPAVMVALFGIATVYLVYRVGKEFFNEKIGLLAASLYALSPLVIVYSRASWNPNIVPFFALFYIYSLYRITSSETLGWRWWLFSGLLIGIGLQLHYLFTFLIITGFVFLILSKKLLKFWKMWVWKILGVIIGWSPFLAFEIRHKFPNAISFYNFIFHGKETGLFEGGPMARVSNVLFRLFGRLVFYFPEAHHANDYSRLLLTTWRWWVIISIAASLGLLVWQIIKKKKKSHFLLLIWLVMGVSLFIFYRKAVYDYYLGFMFPLPFLLIGNLISFLGKKKFKSLGIVFFVALLGINWFGRPIKLPANKQLKQAQEIAQIIFDNANGESMNFALITDGNSDHAYRYFLEIWGNRPVVIETFDHDPDRKTVTSQLFVVCETLECKPLGHSLWEIAGFGRAEIVDEWENSIGIKIMKLVPYIK